MKFSHITDHRDRNKAEKGSVAAYVKAAIRSRGAFGLNVKELIKRAEALTAERLGFCGQENNTPEWKVRWANQLSALLAVKGVVSLSHEIKERAKGYAKPDGAAVIALEFAYGSQVYQIEILADLATLLANRPEGCGLSFEVLSLRSRSVDLPSDKCLPLGYLVGGIPSNRSSTPVECQKGECGPKT